MYIPDVFQLTANGVTGITVTVLLLVEQDNRSKQDIATIHPRNLEVKTALVKAESSKLANMTHAQVRFSLIILP
jgi:hypothetical protein